MNEQTVFRKLNHVPFTQVTIEDAFWAPRVRAHKQAALKACIEKCEETGRISNFEKAAGLLEGGFQGIYFDDSDVYKVLEGIAYSLMSIPDPELERKADEIIDKIAAAQEKDGYLMAYFTIKERERNAAAKPEPNGDNGGDNNAGNHSGQWPDQKWTDMAMHEMYCAGHLIEAAVAYKQATGKRKLLDVACRLVDHIESLFGPGKRHWVEGHQEIELALIKLYHETGEERYWKLAQWLIEERGHGHGAGYIWDNKDWGPAYCQDDKPVRELTGVSGHAVRAMYYYAAVADVAALTGDQGYLAALDRLWDSVVNRNMYITGGIGPSKHNEGFTEDYDMPNDTAYCETCASIGMVLWNHRMNLLHGDGKYADVVERAMYNGVLAGVSLTGDKFFYVNPLSSDGSHHRVAWFDCSCCPTNIARFIPSIGSYVYAADDQGVNVNLYLAGTGTVAVKEGQVQFRQITHYPWEGSVHITIDPQGVSDFAVRLRYPGWCKCAKLSVNGVPVSEISVEKGYFVLRRQWKAGDAIAIQFDMPVERVYAHPKVKANNGKVALQRGPLVYCLEQTDNPFDLKTFSLPAETRFITEHKPDLLDGVTVIQGIAENGGVQFTAIPYYAWDNREPGGMEVWLRETRNPLSLYTS